MRCQVAEGKVLPLLARKTNFLSLGIDKDFSDYYVVRGEIVNTGTRNISLTPFITFYDSSGNVVSWKENLFGFELIPNQVTQFQGITIGPKNVSSFALQVVKCRVATK